MLIQGNPGCTTCVCAQLYPTLCNALDCSPPGSSLQEIFSSKNTVVGCHFLLQGIFPTQEFNPPHILCPLHSRQIFYPLSHRGNQNYSIFLYESCIIQLLGKLSLSFHSANFLLPKGSDSLSSVESTSPQLFQFVPTLRPYSLRLSFYNRFLLLFMNFLGHGWKYLAPPFCQCLNTMSAFLVLCT